MKKAYFHAFSGISGDMVIGALLDAGLSISYLRTELKKLGLTGYTISASKVKQKSITATSFKVKESGKQKNRNYAKIVEIIKDSPLSNKVKDTALDIFEKLARAEAKVHGTALSDVHFHEVGAIDSIVDIVGASIGFHKLGLTDFECSPVATGTGMVKTSHGMMPVPAPATLRLLKGIPVASDSIEMELATPTGVAIVSALCKKFGPLPSMKILNSGYGAGTKVRKDNLPNLFRIIIGDVAVASKTLVVIEANIDDCSPEELAHVVAKISASSALDVWVTSVAMKKGRQGATLSVLCERSTAEKLREMVLEESSSIGIREYEVERYELPRTIEKVKTVYGEVRLKVVERPSGKLSAKPEFDDVSRLALKNGVPFRKVFSEVLKKWEGK